MKDEVSILIPTRFDNRYSLELCIKTIRKYTHSKYRIIVGDDGIDDITREYLKTENEIEIVQCPDHRNPKDYLARIVQTPFFIFIHDDLQILRDGWLERRMEVMEQYPNTGILGVTDFSFVYGWKKYFTFSPLKKRFFPIAMLVRKQTQDELDLRWGIIHGFDTGAVAYFQFACQKKWKFFRYKFNMDMKHWGGMTWIIEKQRREGKLSPDMEKILENRNKKIEMIKNILLTNNY